MVRVTGFGLRDVIHMHIVVADAAVTFAAEVGWLSTPIGSRSLSLAFSRTRSLRVRRNTVYGWTAGWKEGRGESEQGSVGGGTGARRTPHPLGYPDTRQTTGRTGPYSTQELPGGRPK